MDLGIAGKNAIVCAASKGLGKGCAVALARAGVTLVIAARGEDALERTARDIRDSTGVRVTAVVADVTTPEGRNRVLAECPAPDILVNNAGGPPPGDFRDWDRDDWIKALDANMIAPIEFIKRVVDGMIDRRFGRIVNITSSAVKAPIDVLGLSNGARSGLTGFVAGLSRQIAGANVTINNLLPGTMDTDRLTAFAEAASRRTGMAPADVIAQRLAGIPAKRAGTIEEFGAYCAFLCSVHGGFIVGQNLLIDGGAFPGAL